MRLYIRQRMFSWTDSYDVYDESGKARYTVKAQWLSLGHQIHVYDNRTGAEAGAIHERLLTLTPQFDIVVGGLAQGTVRKKITFFRPVYSVNYRGWDVVGDLMGWDYRVLSGGRQVMSITRKLFNLTDTYVLEYGNAADEIPGLLLVIAIDAANCPENH